MKVIHFLRRVVLASVGLLLLSQTPLSAQEPRTWKDTTGKFSVEAVFVSQDESTVRLKVANDRTIQVFKDRLSEADLRYVESLIEPKESTRGGRSSADKRDAAMLEKALTAKLAGPPDAGKASESLPDFLSRLNVPYFVDKGSFNRVGLTTDMKVQTNVNAPTLSDQLDDVLGAKQLAWYRLRTVLVISTEDQVLKRNLETLVYRLAITGNDFSAVDSRIKQVEPSSWDSLGGPGSAQPVPPFVVVRNSEIVHRKLAAALQVSPLPHRYVHPLDNQVVDIEVTRGSWTEFAGQLETQLRRKVTVLEEVNQLGLSNAVFTVKLNGVSAADALNLVLGQIDCAWLEKPDGLEFTSKMDAASKLERHQLAIPFATSRSPATTLQLVMTICAPGSWQPLGGEGQIRHAGGRNFTILQSQPVLRELKQLLADLSGRRN